MVPIGKNLYIVSGKKKMFDLRWLFLPSHSHMYHRFKEDIALFAEMGFKHSIGCPLPLFDFPKGMSRSPMKLA